MPDQDHFWSQAASYYEKEFVDPYDPMGRGNPIKRILRRLADPASKVVADLGCGIGPLLPLLSRRYRTVYAVDFADGMLDRARATVSDRANIQFVRANFTDLQGIVEPVDVAVAVNSLVMPDIGVQEKVLGEMFAALKPGGHLLGILPAMDAVHYQTMLLVDRAREKGLPLDAARKNAAHQNDHPLYDFAFGQFRFQGLEQHFWQPFEIPHRLGRAGFRLLRRKKVHLAWTQFAGHRDLHDQPPPWDWFFLAVKEPAPLPP